MAKKLTLLHIYYLLLEHNKNTQLELWGKLVGTNKCYSYQGMSSVRVCNHTFKVEFLFYTYLTRSSSGNHRIFAGDAETATTILRCKVARFRREIHGHLLIEAHAQLGLTWIFVRFVAMLRPAFVRRMVLLAWHRLCWLASGQNRTYDTDARIVDRIQRLRQIDVGLL